MIQIKIFYFAHLREKRGRGEEILQIQKGYSAGNLLDEIFKDSISKHHLRVAINNEYLGMDTILSHGDEVVFVPPVAGG